MLQQNCEYMNNDPWTRCTGWMLKELWNPFRPLGPPGVWLVDNHMKLTLLLTLQIRGMVLLASLTFRIPNKYIVLKHMIHPKTIISLNIGTDRRINLEKRPTFALGLHITAKRKPVNIYWYSLLSIFVSIKGEKIEFAHDLRNGINYVIRIWVGVTCSIN